MKAGGTQARGGSTVAARRYLDQAQDGQQDGRHEARGVRPNRVGGQTPDDHSRDLWGAGERRRRRLSAAGAGEAPGAAGHLRAHPIPLADATHSHADNGDAQSDAAAPGVADVAEDQRSNGAHHEADSVHSPPELHRDSRAVRVAGAGGIPVAPGNDWPTGPAARCGRCWWGGSRGSGAPGSGRWGWTWGRTPSSARS